MCIHKNWNWNVDNSSIGATMNGTASLDSYIYIFYEISQSYDLTKKIICFKLH